jgi:glutamate dehydrogenase/leucine dehydrogenase/phosphomannomutase
MNSHKTFKAFVASFTALIFTITSFGISPNAFAAAAMPEVSLPYQAALDRSLNLAVPQKFGKLEHFNAGQNNKPAIFHVQTAHGHYEAQQQIREILRYLDQQYGVKTVLVEGSAFKLEPELLNFFPKDPALTSKVNDALTKRAIVKGPELYLLESKGANAYGIEELKAYRENGVAFVNVLEEKQKTEQFLADMNLQIDRLASQLLNKDLRDFLRRVDAFEKNQTPLNVWLAQLKGEAAKRLEIDLASPAQQLDWPMMVRLFKIQELTAKLDKQKFPKERDAFLKAIRRFLPDGGGRKEDGASSLLPSAIRHPSSYAQIEQLLKPEQQSVQLPDPETGMLFEDMVKHLPANFNYEAFPNVRNFIATLLLQSELKADLLMLEVQKLSAAITEKLTRNKIEKKLVALLADHRLLQKLFALELTPEDYEQTLQHNGQRTKDNENSIRPSHVVKRFESVARRALRVAPGKNVQFSHMSDLDALYEKAMRFYEGVKDRDVLMIRRIEERLKETGAQKVAVITGGFHSEPFHRYFSEEKYTYALISPRISGADKEGYAAYIDNVMNTTKRSTRETVSPMDAKVLAPKNLYGIDQVAFRTTVRTVVQTVTGFKSYKDYEKRLKFAAGLATAGNFRAEMRQATPSTLSEAPDAAAITFTEAKDIVEARKVKARVQGTRGAWPSIESVFRDSSIRLIPIAVGTTLFENYLSRGRSELRGQVEGRTEYETLDAFYIALAEHPELLQGIETVAIANASNSPVILDKNEETLTFEAPQGLIDPEGRRHDTGHMREVQKLAFVPETKTFVIAYGEKNTPWQYDFRFERDILVVRNIAVELKLVAEKLDQVFSVDPAPGAEELVAWRRQLEAELAFLSATGRSEARDQGEEPSLEDLQSDLDEIIASEGEESGTSLDDILGELHAVADADESDSGDARAEALQHIDLIQSAKYKNQLLPAIADAQKFLRSPLAANRSETRVDPKELEAKFPTAAELGIRRPSKWMFWVQDPVIERMKAYATEYLAAYGYAPKNMSWLKSLVETYLAGNQHTFKVFQRLLPPDHLDAFVYVGDLKTLPSVEKTPAKAEVKSALKTSAQPAAKKPTAKRSEVRLVDAVDTSNQALFNDIRSVAENRGAAAALEFIHAYEPRITGAEDLAALEAYRNTLEQSLRSELRDTAGKEAQRLQLMEEANALSAKAKVMAQNPDEERYAPLYEGYARERLGQAAQLEAEIGAGRSELRVRSVIQRVTIFAAVAAMAGLVGCATRPGLYQAPVYYPASQQTPAYQRPSLPPNFKAPKINTRPVVPPGGIRVAPPRPSVPPAPAKIGRSEVRIALHHLKEAKTPAEVGHYLAQLLVTDRLNGQDKKILDKALKAEFGLSKATPKTGKRSELRNLDMDEFTDYLLEESGMEASMLASELEADVLFENLGFEVQQAIRNALSRIEEDPDQADQFYTGYRDSIITNLEARSEVRQEWQKVDNRTALFRNDIVRRGRMDYLVTGISPDGWKVTLLPFLNGRGKAAPRVFNRKSLNGSLYKRSETRQTIDEELKRIDADLDGIDRLISEVKKDLKAPNRAERLKALNASYRQLEDERLQLVLAKDVTKFWTILKGREQDAASFFTSPLEFGRALVLGAVMQPILMRNPKRRSEVRTEIDAVTAAKVAERWKKITYVESDPEGARLKAEAEEKGAGFLSNAQMTVRKVAAQIKLDPRVLEKLLQFTKVIQVKIPLTLDEGGETRYIDGYRIGHAPYRGPYKGGIRYAIAVVLPMIKALATEMSFKNAIAGLPYGGGKGGVAINPQELSVKELARLTRGYVAECLKQDPKAFGPLLDVPAGDIGTTSREMGWFADEFLKIMRPDLFTSREFIEKLSKSNETMTPYLEYYMQQYYGKRHIDMSEGSPIATVTAKPEGKGGASGRTPATGLGLYYVTRDALKVYGERLGIGASVKGQKVAVEAYGNVGSYAVRSFRSDGASIMAIKEYVGGQNVAIAAVKDSGIDLDALDKHLAEKNADGTSKKNTVLTYAAAHPEDARVVTIDQFWSSDVTVMVLAAKEKTVNKDIAALIKAKIISEGANGPLELDGSEQILLNKGAIILPDVATNDGGVAFSSLEWRQNNIGELWPEVAGNGLMEDKVVSAFYDISRVSESQKITLREAAYQIAISKIVDAMLAEDSELGKLFDEAHPPYVMDAGAKRWRPETLPELKQIDSRAKEIALIEKADAAMSKKIDELVAEALQVLPAKRGSVILLGGPRAAGKPMLATQIMKRVRAQGIKADVLDMDYQTIEDVSRVLQGKTIFVRKENGLSGGTFNLEDKEVLVVHGYYALSDEIIRFIKAMGGKVYPVMAYSSPDILLQNNWALTAYDLRLMRDILTSVAVGEEKNAQEVIRRWQWQRVSETEAVFATWKNAKRAINTYLPYELPFLKSLIAPMVRVAIQQERSSQSSDVFTRNVLNHLDKLLAGVEGWDISLLDGHHDSVLWEYVQRYTPNGVSAESDGDDIGKVANALIRESADKIFLLTSLQDAEDLTQLPSWISASIERILIALEVQEDATNWYAQNRGNLVRHLSGRSEARVNTLILGRQSDVEAIGQDIWNGLGRPEQGIYMPETEREARNALRNVRGQFDAVVVTIPDGSQTLPRWVFDLVLEIRGQMPEMPVLISASDKGIVSPAAIYTIGAPIKLFVKTSGSPAVVATLKDIPARSEARAIPVLGPTHPELEAKYKEQVEASTPAYVKRGNPIFDITNPDRFEAVLKHAHLYPYKADVAFDPANPGSNDEGLGLMAWLEDYEAEAKVATAGIRLTQNILYPWDTRNRINEIGIAFATLAKASVSKEQFSGKDLEKLTGGESRYNTKRFVDMIARIQAAQGIRTYVPVKRHTTPIWMVSMLAFMFDLVGAEHVTSSHAGSNFSATKDINNQGSQYLPEESGRFVAKIRDMFETAKKQGEFRFTIAAANDPLIDEGLMKATDDGTDVYVQYLKNGVATGVNLDRIRNVKDKIVIDSVGGSMYRTMTRIFAKLGIADAFQWLHTEEDPFFHGIGKELTLVGKVNDYTQDTTVIKRDKKTGETTSIPVMERMGYDSLLKEAPIGKVVLMTDPDGDRLVTGQVESSARAAYLKQLGVEVLKLDENRILAVYSPNQSFFMSMVYHADSLKAAGLWDKHPRFIIMTTASSPAWREWAEKNGVQVLNVPVGFKEIAAMMKKVEYQMKKSPGQSVIVKDVFGREVNLGMDPRMLFAGEESGGMIIGPEELIKSRSGRLAIAMREKSAGEALVIQAAMAAYLESRGQPLSGYLNELFDKNQIASRFDVRHDQTFYNQSEPDPDELKKEKAKGEIAREKNYAFFVNMVLSKLSGKTTLSQIIEILNDAFAPQGLRFDDLQDMIFVGDGVYLQFPDKIMEIRPSGTDAKSKSYGYGNDKLRLAVYAQAVGAYSGEPTDLYKQYVDMSNFEEVRVVNGKPVFRGEDVRWELYQAYYREGLPEEDYQPATVLAGSRLVTPAQLEILKARAEMRSGFDPEQVAKVMAVSAAVVLGLVILDQLSEVAKLTLGLIALALAGGLWNIRNFSLKPEDPASRYPKATGLILRKVQEILSQDPHFSGYVLDKIDWKKIDRDLVELGSLEALINHDSAHILSDNRIELVRDDRRGAVAVFSAQAVRDQLKKSGGEIVDATHRYRNASRERYGIRLVSRSEVREEAAGAKPEAKPAGSADKPIGEKPAPKIDPNKPLYEATPVAKEETSSALESGAILFWGFIGVLTVVGLAAALIFIHKEASHDAMSRITLGTIYGVMAITAVAIVAMTYGFSSSEKKETASVTPVQPQEKLKSSQSFQSSDAPKIPEGTVTEGRSELRQGDEQELNDLLSRRDDLMKTEKYTAQVAVELQQIDARIAEIRHSIQQSKKRSEIRDPEKAIDQEIVPVLMKRIAAREMALQKITLDEKTRLDIEGSLRERAINAYRAIAPVAIAKGMDPVAALRFFYGLVPSENDPNKKFMDAYAAFLAQDPTAIQNANRQIFGTPIKDLTTAREIFSEKFSPWLGVLLSLPEDILDQQFSRKVSKDRYERIEEKFSVMANFLENLTSLRLGDRRDDLITEAVRLWNAWNDWVNPSRSIPVASHVLQVGGLQVIQHATSSFKRSETRADLAKVIPQLRPAAAYLLETLTVARVQPRITFTSETEVRIGITDLAGRQSLGIILAYHPGRPNTLSYANGSQLPDTVDFEVRIERGADEAEMPAYVFGAVSAEGDAQARDLVNQAYRLLDTLSKLESSWSNVLPDGYYPALVSTGTVATPDTGKTTPAAMRAEVRVNDYRYYIGPLSKDEQKVQGPIKREMSDEVRIPDIRWNSEELEGLRPEVVAAMKYWTPKLYTSKEPDVQMAKTVRDGLRRAFYSYEIPLAAHMLKRLALQTNTPINDLREGAFVEVRQALEAGVEHGTLLQVQRVGYRGWGNYDQLALLASSPSYLKNVLRKLKEVYEAEVRQAALKAPITDVAVTRAEIRGETQAVALADQGNFIVWQDVLEDVYEDVRYEESIVEKVTRWFRAGILPLRVAFSASYQRALELLERIGIRKDEAVKLANRLTAEDVRLLEAINAKSLAISKDQTGKTLAGGVVFMDASGLLDFAKNDSRGFYIMLEELAAEQAVNVATAKPILTAGDTYVLQKIVQVLNNKSSELLSGEKAKVRDLLDQVVQVEALKGDQATTINGLAAARPGSMVTVLSSSEMLTGLNEGANFAFKDRLAKENVKLVVRALLGRMRTLATQLDGASAADRVTLLKEFNARRMGGLKKAQGGFIFDNVLLLVQSFLAQERATAKSA